MRGLNKRKEYLISDPTCNFDVSFVQETLFSCEESIKDFSSRRSGPSFWSPALGKQGSLAVLIKENFDGKVISWRKDSCGRIPSLLLETANTRLNLINIYSPANLTERKSFFENLHSFFLPADNIIIGGNFNCYDLHLDKFGGNVSIAN